MDEERNPPEPITLSIPREYRDYLALEWNGTHAFSLSLGLLPLVVLLNDSLRSSRFALWHLMVIPVAIVAWLRELRQPWRYEIDDRGLSLFGLSKMRYFEWGHFAAILTFGIAWLYWWRNPLYYHVDKGGMSVVDCSGSTWSWHRIIWNEVVIVSLTDSAWQNLPALTVRVGSKIDSTITHYSDWQLIYRPEDNHKVRDRVTPAIEYYRAKYGHDAWIADHGWEIYIQPSELLADA